MLLIAVYADKKAAISQTWSLHVINEKRVNHKSKNGHLPRHLGRHHLSQNM